jgi:adenylate cyclase
MKLPRLRRFSLKSLFKRSVWINPATLMVYSLIAVVAVYTLDIHILELIELKTYDLRFLSRGDRKPSPAVAMVVIDEKSLEAEGRWPWPRSKFAALIDTLSREGAKVIGFDVIFSEPDENSELAFIDHLAGQLDTLAPREQRLREFLRERRRHADHDQALREAIKRSTATVVLGYFFHDQSTLEQQIDQDETQRRLAQIAGSKYPHVRYLDPEAAKTRFIKGFAPQTNLPMFSDVAAGAGYFSLQSDRDGVLRWMPLVTQGGDDLYPPLGLVCAWHYLDRPPLTVHVGGEGVRGVGMGERLIPTDGLGKLLINYLGRAKTFPYYSVTDVLNGRVPKGAFKNRIALVGATAVATYDLRNTPVDPRYPGTEVHATVIENILSQDFMTRPEWSRVFDVAAIVGMSALTGVALTRLGPVKGMLFVAGMFAFYVFLARWLFVSARLWITIVYPLLALVTVHILLTVYYYMTEQRERKRIKVTFKQYVAEHVVEEMTKDPTRLKLGGEERVLTVLFSDLEGFTTYSERYTAHEMTEILGDYFTRVTEQIFLHRGTLKEYVGDELMAFFGAPMGESDHASRACAAALAMREQTVALVGEWAKIGRPHLRARTGINSGPMVVGNLGSKYRFAYGVVGDQVNIGSRLEGLNKVYGTDIIIGENTARFVENSFRLRELDMVRVKGRTQVIRIYELIAKADTALPSDHDEALAAYAEALETYRKGMWTEALALFHQTLRLRANDGPARALSRRCLEYRDAPPETWDGIYEQRIK